MREQERGEMVREKTRGRGRKEKRRWTERGIKTVRERRRRNDKAEVQGCGWKWSTLEKGEKKCGLRKTRTIWILYRQKETLYLI